MGRPDVARIKRDADVATPKPSAILPSSAAQAQREAAIAKAQADQEACSGGDAFASQAGRATRDLEVRRRTISKSPSGNSASRQGVRDPDQRHAAASDGGSGEGAGRSRKNSRSKVQEAEILRHEKELIATVLKGAEIEKQRILDLAEADKQRQIAEAEGRASSQSARRGEAEAEIIFKKGEAEAKAMNVQGEAYQKYNQAAVVDKLITGCRDRCALMASTALAGGQDHHRFHGNGDSAGMHKITGDMAQMAAQVPALFEALSGMKMNELLGKVRQNRRQRAQARCSAYGEVGRRRQISGPKPQLLNNGKLPARKFHATGVKGVHHGTVRASRNVGPGAN